MNKTLHITNGDILSNTLRKSGIEGEIITWREILCEGKTYTEVGSENFWRTRFDYLNKRYKITKTKFINFTLKEYRNLCRQKQQSEIVLWFNHNLYSQINLIAIISWLNKHRKNTAIYIIYPEKTKNHEYCNFEFFTKEQLHKLFNDKILLQQDDVEYADYIWQLYCGENPLRLETFSLLQTTTQLKYLPNAMQLHFKRFPTIKNGLNYLENKILERIDSYKYTSTDTLINSIINDQKNYGFTDLQYQSILSDLKKLFTSTKYIQLSKIGKEVFNKSENYYATLKNNTMYFGGTQKYAFL